MSSQVIYVKNMVCDRCVLVVGNMLDELELPNESVDMGRIRLDRALSDVQFQLLKTKLESVGFSLLENRRVQLVEMIKAVIIKYINNEPLCVNIKLSERLTASLKYDYNYLSSLFSAMEGVSIERYHIRHKIEKIKELMFVEKLSLTEIAYRLGYSSLAHLSAQFKKVTGCTPSEYRKLNDIRSRDSLDNLKII